MTRSQYAGQGHGICIYLRKVVYDRVLSLGKVSNQDFIRLCLRLDLFGQNVILRWGIYIYLLHCKQTDLEEAVQRA